MNVTAFKRRKEFGKTLASDIAHRLRGEIVTCRLKPGEMLKFDTLRLAYGASFTTLREALTCLAAEGLVVAEEQRGFKVAPISLADLIDLTRARILIEVDLIDRDGGTLLRMTQSGLPNEAQCAGHDKGWAHYLGRLAEAAAGRNPGLDAWPPTAA